MNFDQARANMVEQQIRPWEVLDQAVLDLLYAVPREDFVPAAYRTLAFADMEIPIGEGERMMAPKIEARIVQELAPRKHERVLEVGTGSGYLTALLAHRAAHVHSVEIRSALAGLGRGNLERHGADNVTLEVGDAARGWPTRAPYDVIVLTGSTPVLPRALLDQLAPGGRLFAVVGEAPVMVARLVTCSAPGAFRSAELFDTLLAPLVNAEQPPRFRF
ncbi:MAG TPA: protein-L-isoaspartate O-methyltransferase [Burkholderiales bacterium]|jgi:protein-L-isoaspartate(D-aspartate) O-methyltransferase|nr:protein-L-isoaspartate O-methyltransferase [Burkholderiales bacterium]